MSSTRIRTWALVCGILLTLVGASCGSGVPGSGVSRTERRALGGFGAVEVRGQARVEVVTGGPALEITADDNLLPLLVTEVRDGTLIIKPERQIRPSTTIEVKAITDRPISHVSVSGSGSVSLKGDVSQSIVLEVSGSGNIVAVRDEDSSISSARAKVSGSGRVDIERVKAGSVKAAVSGSGTLTVHAVDSLNATVSGSGQILYDGQPEVKTSISGSGRVSQK